ncbi:DUF7281 domain-containing protein [Lacimicrobium alkaliphilum]|uniref:DUF7281 domain-containing protein n=1 Tax=Lacimicrobium alkaliphilum TaxID=1526571 RepID=A0ABQ1RFH2_9ALTE|nr:Wadjet anti-phage system protein JetD domain-containing protein [Lacimicrobium alkaliphilum]GGD65334.1 hypothetical protein GCM10011357_20770 [Lacimicrobium alkaliphilum]
MRDLSLRARKKLSTLERNLGLKDSIKVSLDGPLKEILSWCEEQEFTPGRALPPRHFIIDASALVKINQILREHDFSDYRQQFKGLDRAQTAEIDPNEKRAGIAPTANQLLMAVTEPDLLTTVSGYFYSLPQLNLELDCKKLALTDYQSLVVIENRDSFNQWWQYQSPLHGPDTLVVYRGDRGHSRACKGLRKRWVRECPEQPMYYFGDLDLAGLRIAISGRYQGLLLPPIYELAKQLVPQHYPQTQLKFLPGLQRDCPPGWRPLLELITSQRAGLRQQLMLNLPLEKVGSE